MWSSCQRVRLGARARAALVLTRIGIGAVRSCAPKSTYSSGAQCAAPCRARRAPVARPLLMRNARGDAAVLLSCICSCARECLRLLGLFTRRVAFSSCRCA
eukprot:9474285-Pyramimonas_sp.AAC.1